MSILGFREGTFGRVRAGRMLAYRSNIERRVTATLRGDPGSSGVVMGPLRQASVFLIMSTVFGGRFVPYFEMTSNPASPFNISSLTSVTFWTAFKIGRASCRERGVDLDGRMILNTKMS